ncbi:MAG TPA: hypothetical protein VJL80_12300 [Aeromicrobium sp.]|nr:hypothetical protein [Aeromicrobium sp.]HKY58812.1 hypothetical protein [Aeromicrobium sp.]
MSTSSPTQATRLFARVLGPYFVIAMAVYAAKAPDLPMLLKSFDSDPLLPWTTGAFTLITGLVIVALHQVWSGTAAIIITVTGWLTVLKGVVILGFPSVYDTLADSITDATAVIMAQAFVVGGIGLYLTYIGWLRRD